MNQQRFPKSLLAPGCLLLADNSAPVIEAWNYCYSSRHDGLLIPTAAGTWFYDPRGISGLPSSMLRAAVFPRR